MKNFNSVFHAICMVMLSVFAGNAKAQVVQHASPYTTGNAYETSAIAGSGSNTVVALQKPTGEVRFTSFYVAANGAVSIKDYIDFGSSAQVNVEMLGSNRAVLLQVTSGNQQRVTVFDLDVNGNLSIKGDWLGPSIQNIKPAIVRYTDDIFVTGVVLPNGNIRVSRFLVAANGSLTKQGDDNLGGVWGAVDLTKVSGILGVGIIAAGRKTNTGELRAIRYEVLTNSTVMTRQDIINVSPYVNKFTILEANDNLLIFCTDIDNHLDAYTYSLDNAGGFVAKDIENNLKKPNTNILYELKEIDAPSPYNSGEVFLTAIRTSDQHCVVPFFIGAASGNIAVQGGEHNELDFQKTYGATITGEKLVTASQLLNSKYRIQAYSY